MPKKTNLSLFLTIITTLTIVGLVFIYSSSSVFAAEQFNNALYFVKKQLVGVTLGLVGLVIATLIPLNVIKRLTPLSFLLSLGLTALTLFSSLAQSIHGSSRWLRIGWITLQPSELLKLTFILYISYLLSKKLYQTNSFKHSFVPFLCVIGITSCILLKQPDFGLTITLAATAFIMLFIAQFKTKHLFYTITAALPIGISLIYWKPYRLHRILTYLNPWSDPHGAGFQIIQSLIAIGSGHWHGVGIAHSKQKFFYLPMQHTDFIFSIIAEETGFFGCFFIITLFCLLLYAGFSLASTMNDPFHFFVMSGFMIMIGLQALINICVSTGLVPTKGIGLPFISYGNSSLVCNITMVGIIINMVRAQKHTYSAPTTAYSWLS